MKMMNKDEIKYCYNECKGKNNIYDCDNYITLPNQDTCTWYNVMKEDVKKINNRNEYLTFPALEDILIENSIDRNYDSNSMFMYDTKREALLKDNKIIATYDELPKQWQDLGVWEY